MITFCHNVNKKCLWTNYPNGTERVTNLDQRFDASIQVMHFLYQQTKYLCKFPASVCPVNESVVAEAFMLSVFFSHSGLCTEKNSVKIKLHVHPAEKPAS